MHRVELSTLPARLLLPKYRAHLVKAQFVYADQVLLSAPLHLAHRTKLPLPDCHACLDQLARAVLLADPLADPAGPDLVAFTTGDTELDHFVDAHGGGIRLGHLTELAGQSSSGKTNLCLQLACTVQLEPERGGVHGGALFISSEGTLPSRRLAQLAAHFSHPSRDDGTTVTARHFLDNVHVETAPDAETLLALLAYHVPAAIERINAAAAATAAGEDTGADRASRPLPIRLLILDSIAAPFRSAHATGSTGFAQRAKEFVQIGDHLKQLAARYRLAVVVVNQVSDVWDSAARDLPASFLAGDDDHDHDGDQGNRDLDAADGPGRASQETQQPSGPPSTTRGLRATQPQPHPGAGTGLPAAPHRQYSFPSLLYSRFQSPHTTGAFSSVSHPTLLPLPLGPHPAAAPGGGGAAGPSPFRGQQPVAAALGHTWSQIPTSRILCLVRRSSSSAAARGGPDSRTRRCMTMVWSPFAPRACIEYEIDPERGIVAVGETRVRAVPGWESYADADAEEDAPNGLDRGGGGGENERAQGGKGDEDEQEKQYWGSTEDLLLHYDDDKNTFDHPVGTAETDTAR